LKILIKGRLHPTDTQHMTTKPAVTITNRSVYAIAYPAIAIKNKKDILSLAGLTPA